jgi:AraC-like DNA-binding protein
MYPFYSLAFIIEGKGRLIVDDKEFNLSQGEGFLIIPGIANNYIGDSKEPWKYIFVCFAGKGADKLISDAGLSKDNFTFSFPFDANTVRDLYAMLAASRVQGTKGYGTLGYMLALVSRVVSSKNSDASVTWSPVFYVEKAKRFIQNNYMYDITVENVADHVGIDRTYLYRLFLKHADISPSKYIWSVRLDAAVTMLKESNISVNETALSAGFNDVSHFYKAFTAKYGISPKKFRENIWSKK